MKHRFETGGMARRLTLILGTDGGVTRAVSVGAAPTFSVFAPRVSGVVSRQGGFPTTGALVNQQPCGFQI